MQHESTQRQLIDEAIAVSEFELRKLARLYRRYGKIQEAEKIEQLLIDHSTVSIRTDCYHPVQKAC